MKKLIILLLLVGIGFAGWTVPINVSGNGDAMEQAAIAVDSNYGIHIVWTNDSSQVMYVNSSDWGANWGTPVDISTVGVVTSASDPKIAIDSNDKIHIVYRGTVGTNQEVLYRSSTDGVSWSSVVNISNVSGLDGYPSLAIDDNDKLHVSWMANHDGDDILYRSSTNGADWSTAINISKSAGSVNENFLISDSSNNLYIAWVEAVGGNNDIHFSKSTDNGANWIDPVAVTSDSMWDYRPSIGVDSSGNLHLMYSAEPDGNGFDIYYSNSTNGGTTWSTRYNITDGYTYNDDYGTLVVTSDDVVNLLWTAEDANGLNNITYTSSSNGGTTWDSPSLVTHVFNQSFYMYLGGSTIDDQDRIYAAFEFWHDPLDTAFPSGIYFTMSFNAPTKTGFSATELDGSVFDESSTSLTLNNSAINVTWQGLTPSQVYSINGKSFAGTITSDTTSATVSISELNAPANITITGLTGIDSINTTKIIHGSDTVFFNGSLTAANGVDDLIVIPTFSGGNLTLQVANFSDWVVLEDAIYPQIENASVNKTSTVTVTIDWDTNVSSNSTVNYGLTESFGSSATNATMTEDHFINLDGLTTSQTYYYQIISCTTEGNCNTSSTSSFIALHQSEGETVVISAPGFNFTWVLIMFIFAISLFVLVKK